MKEKKKEDGVVFLLKSMQKFGRRSKKEARNQCRTSLPKQRVEVVGGSTEIVCCSHGVRHSRRKRTVLYNGRKWVAGFVERDCALK